jgi:hypothetical protein
LPWARYARGRHLFWRVRIPLWLAAAAAGYVLAGAAGAVGGIAAACLAEALFSYRKTPAAGARARPSDEEIAAIRAHGSRVRRRWATEAAPSPAGWTAPPGVRPAWNWTPPDGIVPRLDRVPLRVRLWYRMPFADRYAHSWMWWHGGWDVLPREPER